MISKQNNHHKQHHKIYKKFNNIIKKIIKFTKKTEEKQKKVWLNKISITILSVIILTTCSFLFGMYYECNNHILSETNIKYIVKKPKYEYKYYYEFTLEAFEDRVYNFIKNSFNEDDPEYTKKVSEAFIKLFNDEKLNKQNVIYYISLCAVESHFQMSARSSCGAVGISQVMPSVWAETVKKNYGITKQELYTDIYKNIYAGYKIWDNYRRKNNGSIKLANAGYLGMNSADYQNKINHNYMILVNTLFKDIFNSEIKHITIKDI